MTKNLKDIEPHDEELLLRLHRQETSFDLALVKVLTSAPNLKHVGLTQNNYGGLQIITIKPPKPWRIIQNRKLNKRAYRIRKALATIPLKK